jgi:hypothetical protein
MDDESIFLSFAIAARAASQRSRGGEAGRSDLPCGRQMYSQHPMSRVFFLPEAERFLPLMKRVRLPTEFFPLEPEQLHVVSE